MQASFSLLLLVHLSPPLFPSFLSDHDDHEDDDDKKEEEEEEEEEEECGVVLTALLGFISTVN